MNKKIIKERIRKLLLEKKGDTHDYGCVMLDLKITKGQWDKFQSLILDEDIYEVEGDRSYGREDEPHITLLYGCLPSVKDTEIENILYSEKTPNISISGISLFKNEKFDVLKFDIDGEILYKLNEKISKLPNENTFPIYVPHCTICYLKSGVGDKVVSKLKEEVDLKDFNEKVGLLQYVYSKPNGSKVTFELKND